MKVLHTKEAGQVKIEILEDENGALWGYRFVNGIFANRTMLEEGQKAENTAEYLALMSMIGGM